MRSGRLTRRFLEGLEEGLYLASNLADLTGRVVYQGPVVSAAGRARQWTDIVDSGADGRTARVFGSRSEFEAWCGFAQGYLRLVQ